MENKEFKAPEGVQVPAGPEVPGTPLYNGEAPVEAPSVAAEVEVENLTNDNAVDEDEKAEVTEDPAPQDADSN